MKKGSYKLLAGVGYISLGFISGLIFNPIRSLTGIGYTFLSYILCIIIVLIFGPGLIKNFARKRARQITSGQGHATIKKINRDIDDLTAFHINEEDRDLVEKLRMIKRKMKGKDET